MGFEVTAAAYGSFMGRFSEPLAPAFAGAAGVSAGQRVLDVGAGPGALTAVLVDLVGPDQVAAIDPSQSFVAALRDRLPGVEVRAGSAEELPWEDASFDVALAQLVVHFMRDPVTGLREMGRVTRPGGIVSASVWDHAGGGGPLSLFWDAVHELDPLAGAERGLAGAREGHLAELFAEAGLDDVSSGVLSVDVAFAGLDEWWEPFTYGVGPAGAYVADLDETGREALKAECARRLPDGPFTLTASAWVATARAR
ncbi:class I SAM-dependent methyltransferase [Pedococcus sp. P5_B7]